MDAMTVSKMLSKNFFSFYDNKSQGRNFGLKSGVPIQKEDEGRWVTRREGRMERKYPPIAPHRNLGSGRAS